MTFIKTPTKGMRDFLPKDMELREYVLEIMKQTYQKFGFELIATPAVEHIENLTSNQGGENEKLIFKILKRGDKLKSSDQNDLNSLVDSGLRYDLTVPLARLYANNKDNLSYPFRAFQTGYSYRAERPQKGRYRELMQCDLDIIGEKTILAEIELITAVLTFLKNLNFQNFQIKINDRRLLKSMLEYAKMPLEQMDQILITIDKIDKIGLEGIKEELKTLNISENNIDTYLSLFNNNTKDISSFCKNFSLDNEIINDLETIITTIKQNTSANIIFDPTLVRGMGYYTGPIFEIYADEFPSAIGGGGRYDHMIEKYANIQVPACGFSIGFERLILLLKERDFKPLNTLEKYCVILNKETPLISAISYANELRKENKIVKIVYKNKNYKYQKEMLNKENYNIIEK